MISAIIDWLNDPRKSYKSGVILYDRYGKSEVLKKLFAGKESDFVFTKLYTELKRIDAEQPKPEAAQQVIVASSEFKKYAQPKSPKINRELLPERLKMLDIRKGEFFNEASYLNAQKNKLPITPEYNEERRKKMERIEFLFDIIDGIWAELDHFQQT